MNIALIDCDFKTTGKSVFPNLCLMKLSAWLRQEGHTVRLVPYDEYMQGNLFVSYDRAYGACVFTKNADKARRLQELGVIVGGTGITLKPTVKDLLPGHIEHIMPDYSLYGITDTAYGFLTRGCPRHCPFCIVGDKEGTQSRKVANLSEWWNGQKYIKLLDPNLLACDQSLELLTQLSDSGAWIDFTQGVDVRLLTSESASMIANMKIKMLHFAWDNPKDKRTPKMLELFKTYTKNNKSDYSKHRVYVLTNYWSTLDEDLMRIYWLREHNYDPYVMVFDKDNAPRTIRRLQRWVNNKWIFRKCERFEDYE